MNQINENASTSGAPDWLPGSARRIVLVSGSASDDLGGPAAVEVAEMVARHRPRTLFVNTVTGSAGPDESLGVDDRPGLGDIASGRSRVSEVAVIPEGQSFIFVPAGGSGPGMSALCRLPAFRHLVDAAGRGGTLLLHVVEADLPDLFAVSEEGTGPEFDGLVLLGGIAIPPDVAAQVRVLARVEREAGGRPPPSERTSESGGTSGFSRPGGTPVIVAGARGGLPGRLDRLIEDVRKRGEAWGAPGATGASKRSRGGLGRLVDVTKRRLPRGAGGVAIIWIVAVLAGWLVWQGLSGWPAFDDDFDSPVESAAIEQPPPGLDGEEDAPVEQGALAADGGNGDAAGAGDGEAVPAMEEAPGEEPAALPETGPADGVVLPYSVLVASYVTYEDAAAKRDELKESGTVAFVAPTPVRGRLYYRVFAGALEDRVQASDLMDRLVEQGSKERERDWDMRPARLAFALGDYSSAEDAEAEVERLHGSGVPAYLISVGDTTGAIYRLYSGAFESEAAAAPADTLLSIAGQAATLVTRRGDPR